MEKLLEIQKRIGQLSKNAENPFFKSQYLDLNNLLTHVLPLLNEQGLLLLQPIKEGSVFSTIIDSGSGEVIAESSITLPPSIDPQKMGSAITYFRRYTLKSLLSISEKDDDGNSATLTMEQVVELINKATKLQDLTDIKAWVIHYNLNTLANKKAEALKS